MAASKGIMQMSERGGPDCKLQKDLGTGGLDGFGGSQVKGRARGNEQVQLRARYEDA